MVKAWLTAGASDPRRPLGLYRDAPSSGISLCRAGLRRIGSRRLVALDVDLGGALTHGVAVVPGLHTQQRVHGDAEGLFDVQRHLWRQGRLAVDEVGEGCAA